MSCLKKPLQMTIFRSKENKMKKALLGLVAFAVLSATAYACQTQTIIVNGKMTTCTVCGSVVNCF